MVDERIIELINKEIDGEILPAEQAMLEGYRAGNPEVAAVSLELRTVTAALDDIAVVEPPPTLKSGVFRSIGEQHHPVIAHRPMETLRAHLAGVARYRVAYGFSAGLAAGIALFALFVNAGGSKTVQPSDVAGSIITGTQGTHIQAGTIVPVTSPRVNGTIATSFSGNVAILSVKLSSSDRLRTRFGFDAGVLTLRALQRGSEAPTSLGVQGGIVDVQTTGSDGYTIYLDRKNEVDAPVKVSIYNGDDLVFERTVAAGHPSR